MQAIVAPSGPALARLVLCAAAMLAAGCASLRDEPGPWEPAVPEALAPPPPANGAIYQAGYDVPLFENAVARRVGDVMTQDCPVVDGNTNLQTFADEYLLRTGRRCFVVAEQGRISGLVTPHEIKEVERSKWALTTLDSVMRPLESLRTVAPETPVTEALELMGREDLNQLPVMLDGQLAGIISRGHILQLLQSRAELNM